LLIVGNLRKIFIDLDRAHHHEETNPSSIFTYLQKQQIPTFWRGDFQVRIQRVARGVVMFEKNWAYMSICFSKID